MKYDMMHTECSRFIVRKFHFESDVRWDVQWNEFFIDCSMMPEDVSGSAPVSGSSSSRACEDNDKVCA